MRFARDIWDDNSAEIKLALGRAIAAMFGDRADAHP
jgi:hypothetical protein